MAKRDSNFNPLGRSRGLRAGQTSTADWTSSSSALVIKAISTASIAGGALRFGYSKDGGAYALGIYGDGEPYTVFVPPSDDIDITLQDVIDLFDSLRDDKLQGHLVPE